MNSIQFDITVTAEKDTQFGLIPPTVYQKLMEESAIEGTITLKLTHEAIGNHTGNPREVVTRMLRYFQNEGMVRLNRGTVEIIDVEKLEALRNA